MEHKLLQQKAHGDAAVYRVWDDEHSVELYVDYTCNLIHVNSGMDRLLMDVETKETQWINNAREYLRNQL